MGAAWVPSDWLSDRGDAPASDLDLAVAPAQHLDLLEDPADRMARPGVVARRAARTRPRGARGRPARRPTCPGSVRCARRCAPSSSAAGRRGGAPCSTPPWSRPRRWSRWRPEGLGVSSGTATCPAGCSSRSPPTSPSTGSPGSASAHSDPCRCAYVDRTRGRHPALLLHALQRPRGGPGLPAPQGRDRIVIRGRRNLGALQRVSPTCAPSGSSRCSIPLLAALRPGGDPDPVTAAGRRPARARLAVALRADGQGLGEGAPGLRVQRRRPVRRGGQAGVAALGRRDRHGRGVTWLLRPEGGYYARPGRIVLRAEGLGVCPDGTAAYTRLEFRVAHRPGGPVGQALASLGWRRRHLLEPRRASAPSPGRPLAALAGAWLGCHRSSAPGHDGCSLRRGLRRPSGHEAARGGAERSHLMVERSSAPRTRSSFVGECRAWTCRS